MTGEARTEFEKWYSKTGFNHRYCAESSWSAGAQAIAKRLREMANPEGFIDEPIEYVASTIEAEFGNGEKKS